MRLTSFLASSHRSRARTPPSRAEAVEDTRLGRAIVLAQVILLAWCGARAASDWLRGPLSFEGTAAIALVALFVVSVPWRVIRRAAGRTESWTMSGSSARDRQALAELARAEAHLAQSDPAAARRIATEISDRAVSSRTRNAALTTLAWAALAEGYVARANAALERVDPPYLIDLGCFAAVRAALGETDLAVRALELARSARSLDCEGAKLLVDLYVRRGRMDQAVTAAVRTRTLLGIDNCTLVAKAASEVGWCPEATLSLLRPDLSARRRH
jgi:hypothetical protein